MTVRISLTPDSFASGPLLALVPSAEASGAGSLDSLRALEVALFSRYEQLQKNTVDSSDESVESRNNNEREKLMLKVALDWCAASRLGQE